MVQDARHFLRKAKAMAPSPHLWDPTPFSSQGAQAFKNEEKVAKVKNLWRRFSSWP